ncbi:MAG TPA: carboxylesterase family protein [Gemmatimonadales bacterium]|nr:carboxylesterase family protein [Gemmatimonadales bacterium]
MTTLKTAPAESAPSARQVVITTIHGALRGSLADGVHTFLGVPYAAPPFGANRLRPPRPVQAWAGVRDALTYSAKPPQLPYLPPWDVLIPERGPLGEDCLNLNIWTPEPRSAGLPVMVWIPGGMFEAGSGATYNGSHFARDGVVCVTINYRVGAEGFLYLGEGNANRGLLDQVAALEWVRDNIAAFGGSPDNVTIFGRSAGGTSVGTLLSMPRGAGELFSAIQGDWLFRIPALRLAEAHAKNSEATYVYEFAWRAPQFDGRLGACHGADVAFVFDDLNQETEELAGSNPPQQLADRMHAAWIAFARNGDPGWAKYDLTRRATMRFDTRSEVVDDPQSIERTLWAGIR